MDYYYNAKKINALSAQYLLTGSDGCIRVRTLLAKFKKKEF